MTISNEIEEEKNYCEICMDDEKMDCISPNQYDTEFKSYCSHSACTDCWRANKSGKCFYCQSLPNLQQIYVSGYDNYDTLPVRDGLLRYF